MRTGTFGFLSLAVIASSILAAHAGPMDRIPFAQISAGSQLVLQSELPIRSSFVYLNSKQSLPGAYCTLARLSDSADTLNRAIPAGTVLTVSSAGILVRPNANLAPNTAKAVLANESGQPAALLLCPARHSVSGSYSPLTISEVAQILADNQIALAVAPISPPDEGGLVIEDPGVVGPIEVVPMRTGSAPSSPEAPAPAAPQEPSAAPAPEAPSTP